MTCNKNIMRKIVITLPDFINDEAEKIDELLHNGTICVHIRKPGKSAEEVAQLLKQIPEEDLPQVTLHDHFELLEQFPLVGGVHLNSRNPEYDNEDGRRVSRSCHSLEEVKACKDKYDYVFLSPIFDSISKPGYKAAFTDEELTSAAKEGIIDDNVFALGGVTEAKLPLLNRYVFGGYAMLGAAWGK